MATISIQELKFGLNCGIAINRPWDCLHRHDEVELTFFLTSSPVIYRIGAKIFKIYQSDTILFWGSIPHQLVEISKDVEQYWLTIPPELFLYWNLPGSLTREIMNGQILTEQDEELRKIDIASFPLWIKETKAHMKKHREVLSLALEARLLCFGGFAAQENYSDAINYLSSSRIITNDTSSFERMYDYIIHNFKRSIHIEEIADSVNLHPNYALTLFHKKCGTKIVDFINMLRVYEAQRLLLTTDMKIIDIAMETGFGSMSNFYNCFKRVCRKNPKEYRQNLKI